jgi:hypothetical protein
MKVNMEIDIPDATIEKLADAIAARLVKAGTAAKGGKAKPEAHEAKPETQTPPTPPSTDVPPRADVLAKIRELGDKTSRDKAAGLIQKYGTGFKDVKDEDLGLLLADVEKALAGDGEEGDSY